MVEFLYEYQGTQYIHWAAVAAVVVLLVYYIKQYYCAEGFGPTQSNWTGPGGVYAFEHDQGLHAITSAAGRGMDSLGIVSRNTVGDFAGVNGDPAEKFLSGREPPVILPYPALGPHQYMKAVHDAVVQDGGQVAGFNDGIPRTAYSAGEGGLRNLL